MFSKSKDKAEPKGEDGGEGPVSPLANPNRTFWIVPHTGFTKVVNVLDLTALTKAPYPSEEFEKETTEIAAKSPPEAWLTITRTPRWYSRNFVIEQPSKPGEISQWKGGIFSTSSNTLQFPQGSPHSSHPIKIEAENSWKFCEQFVKDSVTYQWKPDNAMTARKFTMYKIIRGQKQEVGRYWQGWRIKDGGTMVLNSDEIDEVVAVVSMVNILRKKRQKAAEFSGGS